MIYLCGVKFVFVCKIVDNKLTATTNIDAYNGFNLFMRGRGKKFQFSFCCYSIFLKCHFGFVFFCLVFICCWFVWFGNCIRKRRLPHSSRVFDKTFFVVCKMWFGLGYVPWLKHVWENSRNHNRPFITKKKRISQMMMREREITTR